MAKQGHWQKMSDDEGNEFEAWVDGVLPPPSEGAEQDSESLPEPADVEPTENANTQDPVSIFGDVDREPAPQEQEFDLPSASEDTPQPTQPDPSFVPESPTPPPEREPISPEFTPTPTPTIGEFNLPSDQRTPVVEEPDNNSSVDNDREKQLLDAINQLINIQQVQERHLKDISDQLEDGVKILL